AEGLFQRLNRFLDVFEVGIDSIGLTIRLQSRTGPAQLNVAFRHAAQGAEMIRIALYDTLAISDGLLEIMVAEMKDRSLIVSFGKIGRFLDQRVDTGQCFGAIREANQAAQFFA